MLKPAVSRSACDQCRAKRVRCLRAQDSIAPCARCCYMGARCVTGAPGCPGRPPKKRLDVSSPGPHRTSTLQDTHQVEVHAPTLAVIPASVRASKSSVHPRSARDLVVHETLPDLWIAPDDTSAFFSSPSPSMDQNPAPGEDILSLLDHLSGSSHLQGLLSADHEYDEVLHTGGNFSTALDTNIDPLLDHGETVLPTTPLPQYFSVTSSLVRFREGIDQHIETVDAYYSTPSEVLQRCKDGGADSPDIDNPASLLLSCTKEFINIIQSLTPAASLHMHTEGALSTEILLLALSSYLVLMRLLDSLFHRIYRYLCQVSPESYKCIKVKSVLRIGGVSSLHDMSLKAYAIGIIDAIQDQVLTLELCMGIPAEYCLSREAAASPTATAPGIFSRAHRAQLFWAVMAQEDVKPRQGTKSYVESIRASIKESMAFLDDSVKFQSRILTMPPA